MALPMAVKEEGRPQRLAAHSARGKRQLGAGGAGAREWAHALTDNRVADTVGGAADGTRGRHGHRF